MAEERLRTLVSSAAWALRRTWAVHRGLTATLVVASLVRSLVPAGVVLAGRGLINAVSAGLGGGTAGLPANVRSSALVFGSNRRRWGMSRVVVSSSMKCSMRAAVSLW